jgi:hypothetical protein
MGQRRHDPEPENQPVEAQRGIWGSRACLVGGTIVYLGLAALSLRWRPSEPFIASIWIFLAAHSAAYLLVQELRGHRDEPSS